MTLLVNARTGRWCIGAAAVLSMAFPRPSAAQDRDLNRLPGVRDSLRLSSLTFDRTLNTYLWQGRIALSGNALGAFVTFQQDLRSRLVQTAERAIQDEAITNVQIDANLGGSWQGRGVFGSSMLSDNRSAELGRLAEHRALAGVAHVLDDRFRWHAMGGVEFASQELVRETGPALDLGAEGIGLWWKGLRSDLALRTARAYLDRRTPATDSLRVRLMSDFGPAASNAIGVLYARQQREFFAQPDSVTRSAFGIDRNIFRRQEQSVQVVDTLTYAAGQWLMLAVHGGVLNRIIDRGYRYKSFQPGAQTQLDSRIRELRFFGGLSSTLRPWSGAVAGAGFLYEERDERHSVIDDPGASDVFFDQQERIARRLGNVARRATTSAWMEAMLGERDTLSFSGSAGILRYDTPDTLNTDDRDEVLFTMGVEERHRFSDALSVSAAVDLTLSHLVYLHRLQSANNNWNRILALRLRVDARPAAGVQNVLTSEVLANYTVFDFEEQVQSVRSFSFRQAYWVDSLAARLSSRMRLELAASVRLFERGLLKWKEFRERPENLFLEVSVWPRLVTRPLLRLLVGVGYRYFAQDRYRYEGETRIFERRFRSTGPTAALAWEGGRWGRVTVEGWRERQEDGDRVLRTVSNLMITVGMLL